MMSGSDVEVVGRNRRGGRLMSRVSGVFQTLRKFMFRGSDSQISQGDGVTKSLVSTPKQFVSDSDLILGREQPSISISKGNGHEFYQSYARKSVMAEVNATCAFLANNYSRADESTYPEVQILPTSQYKIEKEPDYLKKVELLDWIGEGRYGKMAKIRLGNGQICALKMVRKLGLAEDLASITKGTRWCGNFPGWDEEVMYAFRLRQVARERNAMVMNRNNRYAVPLFAAFQNETHLFLAMQYMPGGNLGRLFHNKGKLPESKVKRIMAELVCGLQTLHMNGIIHRNLKLDNIFINHCGHIRISDYGLSTPVRIMDSKPVPSVEYPCFLAPEALLRKRCSIAMDWWSLGVCIYMLLNGRHPFMPKRMDTKYDVNVIEMVTNRSYSRPNLMLSRKAKNMISWLLKKIPEERIGMACSPAGNIRDHAWLRNICWEDVARQRLKPILSELFCKKLTGRVSPGDWLSKSMKNDKKHVFGLKGHQYLLSKFDFNCEKLSEL